MEETSKGDRRRKALFGVLSRNLQFVKRDPRVRISPDVNDAVICPICFKLFTKQSLSKEFGDHLTLEDVPPKALGGRPQTLTCKVCNNWAGQHLDGRLLETLQVDEFLQRVPGARMATTFRVGEDIAFTSVTQITSKGAMEIICDPARSHPDSLKKLRHLEKLGVLPDIKIAFRTSSRIDRSQIALIRIAYLSAFSLFGYGFLMNPYLVPVRGQIQGPDATVLPDWGILRADFPDEAVGVNIIYEPDDLQCFLVVFDLETGNRKTRHGVVLPGPTSPGTNTYFRIAELRTESSKRAITHKLRGIPRDDYLLHEDLAFASEYYWHEFRK